MPEFVRRIDIRRLGRRELMGELAALETEAVAHFGGPVLRHVRSDGAELVVEFQPVWMEGVRWTAIGPVRGGEVSGMGNGVTGASDVSVQFRDGIAALRERMAKAGERVRAAVAEMHATADQAEATAAAIEQESAELRVAIAG